jgi:glucosamine--fructose-6-phosphate aminotransferase (isomerizing)
MPEPTTALERAIRSQPDELERLTEVDLGRPIELLEAARRVWLVGTGTSQHAAELGAAMLHEAGRDAVAVPSMHFVTWPRPLDRHDAVVLISHNAGAETAYAAAAHARATRAGLAVLPITRVGGGLPNALETVAQERSHTYTVSYTAVLLLLARIAGALGARTLDPETIRAVPEAVRRALENPGVEAIEQPDRLLVVFGSGPASVTAREGALKLREAARLPAEGYDAEYLLHGSAVPLTPDDAMVALLPPDPDGLVEGLASAAERSGIPVGWLREGADLPPPLAQIPLTVRLQLLALRLATERSRNPDIVIEGPWADEALWAIGAPGG